MNGYSYLTLEQRREIERMYAEGERVVDIAARLKRSAAGQELGEPKHRAVQAVQLIAGHRKRQVRPRTEDDARGLCRGALPPDGLEDRNARKGQLYRQSGCEKVVL